MAVRIVITDDHAVFRSGLRALLEREMDFEIVGETGSGAETIALAEQLEFDVLLLDISMPDLSGARVAEELLRKHPKLEIIVLTMHEHEHYLRELLQIGARGYVLKKSTGTELVQAIRSVSRGNTYVDPAIAGLLVPSFVGKPAPPQETNALQRLTHREKEVCRLLALGYTNSEAAEMLHISLRTIEAHRYNIMTKLNLATRAELVRFAMEKGLLQSE